MIVTSCVEKLLHFQSRIFLTPILLKGVRETRCNSFQRQQIKATGAPKNYSEKQMLPRIFYYLRTAETTAGDLLIHVEILMLI